MVLKEFYIKHDGGEPQLIEEDDSKTIAHLVREAQKVFALTDISRARLALTSEEEGRLPGDRNLSELSPTYKKPFNLEVSDPAAGPALPATQRKEFKEWRVNGTLEPSARDSYYYVDQMEQNIHLLERIKKGEFVQLYGPRSSGKSSGVLNAMIALEQLGFECIYVTLEGCLFENTAKFWSSLGIKLGDYKIPVTIKNSAEFQSSFGKSWPRWTKSVVLFIDEFDTLLDESCVDICSSVLSAIRGLKIPTTMLKSIVIIGTFAILELNQQKRTISPFTVTEAFRVRNFTADDMQKLFKEYSMDYKITIVPEVVESIFELTNGHAGLVCLCGRAIHRKIYPLVGVGGVVNVEEWEKFATRGLLAEVTLYPTFRRLVETFNDNHKDALDLVRSTFLGVFDEYITIDINNERRQSVAFLAAEGVLQSDPTDERLRFRMASPIVDALMRVVVIPRVYPNAPIKPVPMQNGSLDVPMMVQEALRFVDKELITLSPIRSFKLSGNLYVNGSVNQKVPRESVYDQELCRILMQWLNQQEAFTVTSQWHTEDTSMSGNAKGKHKFLDLVISKNDTIVLELLATSGESGIQAHVEKAHVYKARVGATSAWVIHFTREDDYLNHAYWPSEETMNNGVHLLHIWHNANFTAMFMSGRWKDTQGSFQRIDNVSVDVNFSH